MVRARRRPRGPFTTLSRPTLVLGVGLLGQPSEPRIHGDGYGSFRWVRQLGNRPRQGSRVTWIGADKIPQQAGLNPTWANATSSAVHGRLGLPPARSRSWGRPALERTSWNQPDRGSGGEGRARFPRPLRAVPQLPRPTGPISPGRAGSIKHPPGHRILRYTKCRPTSFHFVNTLQIIGIQI